MLSCMCVGVEMEMGKKTSIRITKSGNNWFAPTHKCKVPQIGVMGSS